MSREIEDRLRAALSARADSVDQADLRPPHLPTDQVRQSRQSGPSRQRSQRRRVRRSLPWLAPVLAAAAVAAVVAGVATGPSGRHPASTNSAAGRTASSLPPAATTPAPTKSATPPEPSVAARTDQGPLRDAAQLPTVIPVPGTTGSTELKLLPSAVLGSSTYWPAGNTSGFGTSQPSELNTNGDRSGIVLGITWQDWGAASATGTGRTYLPKPAGGYYDGTVPIQLLATMLGRCGSQLGYAQLYYRTPSQPGGQISGDWQLWAGADNLCQQR